MLVYCLVLKDDAQTEAALCLKNRSVHLTKTIPLKKNIINILQRAKAEEREK